jgi:large subunit ribosomal protein L6
VEGINRIKVAGIEKEVVGEMAANIRAIRPPDAYKGKGIRYAGELVRLKAGKSGKTIGRK